MSAYQNLTEKFELIHAINHANGILGWDEAVMMPENSGEERGFAQSKLAGLYHEILTSEEVAGYLAKSEENLESLDDWSLANLKIIRKKFDRATALDKSFVEKQTALLIKSEQAWRKARAANDWKGYLPLFKEVIQLAGEEAEILGRKFSKSPYDALLDIYEPDLELSELNLIFSELKKDLPDIIQAATEKSEGVSLQGPFSIPSQEKFARRVLAALEFDFKTGRLDISHHPFCGGAKGDIRITTRYQEADFLESFLGVVHECGHAQYDQHTPTKYRHQPVGNAGGMAIHEGQSLFFEMQLACGREFWNYFYPMAKEEFPSLPDFESFMKRIHRVEPGLIRVMADEVTYPAHILIRFEIEQDLLSGKLKAEDLPEVWQAKSMEYLGIGPGDDFANGHLQDVHWPGGSFGYFPTYSLGAMYAAANGEKFRQDEPQWGEEISKGNFQPAMEWLRQNIWGYGMKETFKEQWNRIHGENPNCRQYLSHLKRRYLS